MNGSGEGPNRTDGTDETTRTDGTDEPSRTAGAEEPSRAGGAVGRDRPARTDRTVSILGHPVAGLAPIAFLSAGWLLLALQVMPVFRARYAEFLLAGSRPGFAELWPPPATTLLWLIIAAGLLVIGAGMTIVWILSAGGLGPLSDRLLRRQEAMAGIILIAAGVLTAALISRGEPSLEDTKTHVARGWLWFESIRAGALPHWTDLWYGGTPADQHYPPLAHAAQALLGFLRFGPYTAAKVLAWISAVAGAVGFALFTARVHRDTRAGLLGGLIYALAPATHAAWIWEGRIPGVLMLAILPWAFLAAERISTGIGGSRAGAGLALAVAAMILAHTTQARAAIAVLFVFSLLRAIPTMATRGARAPSVPGLAIGWIGAAVLTGAFLFPIAREVGLLNDIKQASLFGFTYTLPPAERLGDLLRWNLQGRDYLGISIGLLALGGIARAVMDRREGGRGIGPVPLAILLVVPWVLVNPRERGLDLVFIGALIAAAGVVRRGETPPRLPFVRLGLYPVAILLVLIDLAPLALVTSYGEHRERRNQVYEELQGPLLGGRFLELRAGEDGSVLPSHWSYAPDRPLPSIGGPFPQGAPKAFRHLAAMIDSVAYAIEARRPLHPDLVEWMAVQNVRAVFVGSPTGPVVPPGVESDLFRLDPERKIFFIDHAAPVAVLEPGAPPPPADPDAVVGKSGMDRAVSRRLAAESIAWVRDAHIHPLRDARAVVLPNRMEVEMPDVGAATIRIARNAYPSTEVRVDGREWPWQPGPLGGIVLNVEAGPHKIEIRGVENRVRRFCRYGQWGLAGLLFLLAIGPRRR